MAEKLCSKSFEGRMDIEIFVPIKGYEGRYSVSNWGRVKSLPKYTYSKGYAQLRKERILKGCVDGAGYNFVVLSDGKGCSRDFKVHRLVAEAFIPNEDALPQVNHKDENKNNNRADNLEWCNNAYNKKYSAKPLTAEHKQKISRANRGKVRTDAQKEVYRKRTLERYKNPSEHKKTSLAVKCWWERRKDDKSELRQEV